MEAGANVPPHPPPHFPTRRRNSGPLRLLCKSSTADTLTSRPSNPFDLIARDTGASISVEEPHPDSNMRFVVVKQGRTGEALVRAFESTVEVEGTGLGSGDVVCRVMMAKILVGLFMGKKGRNVDRIRQTSGAKIRVFSLETVIPGAVSADEVVQIQGDSLSVKKALTAVSTFLQGSSLSGREHNEGIFLEMVTHDTSPDASREHHIDASILPTVESSISHALSRPKLYDGNYLQETHNMHEISYRLLCANHNIGGVIGHGGAIVKALEKETGTYIRCGGIVAQSDERVITITGFESQGTKFSPTQNAVIRVFTRIIEASIEGRAGADKDGTIIIRLLVPCNQIGYLMVKGGAAMSEIGKNTSTDIMIISGGQVPKCASRNDEVIQVSGKLQNVQDCLFRITSKLRDCIFSRKLPVNGRSGFHSRETSDASLSKRAESTCPWVYESLAPSSDAHQQSILSSRLDQLRLHSNGHISSQQIAMDSLPRSRCKGGQTPFGSGAELGRMSNPVVVTNTALEILVPGNSISQIYGKDGSNLNNIRQISGAKVTVSDPLPGASEMTIVISGTPDQTLAAQSLFQAYLLSGKS